MNVARWQKSGYGAGSLPASKLTHRPILSSQSVASLGISQNDQRSYKGQCWQYAECKLSDSHSARGSYLQKPPSNRVAPYRVA